MRFSTSMPQLLGNPGEPLMAELIDAAVPQVHRTLNRFRALGDDADEMRGSALEPLFDQTAHLLDVVGLLGDQRHVRAGGQPGIQRDPAGVPSHHLDQHHPLMRFSGAVQPVDRLGGDHQGGVMTECHVGAVDVVVDGLGHPDDGYALLGQPMRRGERPLAADRDQHVDPVVLQGRP